MVVLVVAVFAVVLCRGCRQTVKDFERETSNVSLIRTHDCLCFSSFDRSIDVSTVPSQKEKATRVSVCPMASSLEQNQNTMRKIDDDGHGRQK